MTPTPRAGTLRACSLAAATAALVFGPAGPASAAGDGAATGEGLRIDPASAPAGTRVDIRADCAGDGGTVLSPAFTSAATLHPAAPTTRGTAHGPMPGTDAGTGTASRTGAEVDADARTGDGPGAGERTGGVAHAVVKSGLEPGRRYVVVATCAADTPLTSSFLHTGGPAHRTPASGTGPGAGTPGGTAPADGKPPADGRGPAVGTAAPDRHGTASGHYERGSVGNAALAMGGGLTTAGLAGYVLTMRRGAHGDRRPATADGGEP
ncbi:hypothetical protein [Streptomyces phytohabitans]|uniref:hypothetical protein n=1 Tax=Streptomyces phytohabitans TaxID=1150371 RepID=UPI00345BC7AC